MIELNPNFKLIKEFLDVPAVNAYYFEGKIDWLNENHNFSKVEDLVKKYCKNDHNIFFFWCYYYEAFLFSNYATDIELFKAYKLHNKDLDKFQLLIDDFDSNYYYHKTDSGKQELFIKSLSFEFVNDRGVPKTTTIKSVHLIHNILYLLKRYKNDFTEITFEEKNVKSYFTKFILSTKPFFKYLKKYHFSKISNNKTYEFIVCFLETMDLDLNSRYEIPSHEVIKQIYKAG